MVATAIIQIIERNDMVALFKSLGAHTWQINVIILCNSLYTLYWGMLYGNILGMGLCFFQSHYKLITLETELYYMQHVPISWVWQTIFFPSLCAFCAISLGLYGAITLFNKNKIIEVLELESEISH
ncbi:FtsX-like permease family protein [Cardinium endosymbiont of Culicoides punctatus]|uniref:FtsX-like permease family protein n=1 Tax=Cardinium endosymbiont of Culicoides punctatus TaxID=2304601 RepID=UPI0010584008|nr:FtsX-like permease family protein [Cardinium endosymbiont of Culicoides punctatus]TDG94781.1 hypothetical protein CCPUN_07320 [Cardinium endosymbiont of Culicoides punctatus]